MADEFDHHLTNNNCNGNWFWVPSRNRFENNNNAAMDSAPVLGSTSNSMVIQDHIHEKTLHDSDDRGGGVILTDHGLQIMGFGLSQAMDWNQALLSGKPEGSFRLILEQDGHLSTSNNNYQQETGMALSPQQHFQWTAQQKIFSKDGEEDSSISQGLSVRTTSNFKIDNSSIYESPSPSTMLQGFSGSSHHYQPQHIDQSPFENQHRSMDYPNYVANYRMNTNEFSHFMRNTNSPPKQPVPQHTHLNFLNNAPFWNTTTTTAAAAAATTMSDHVPLSSLTNSFQQLQLSMPPTFDEKPIKPSTSEVRNSSSGVKKSGREVSMKRPRNKTSSSSPLPPLKVMKEMSQMTKERIAVLQQLVSPYGKTDQASVLSETMEYIKFLHEQVAVLSTPYMKSGTSIQHHNQRGEKSKDSEWPKQELRSRGLCLVPISSTFPVTHESTTADFWTPTFGGTFR